MSDALRSLIKVAYPEFTDAKYSIFTDKQLAEMNELIKYADYYDNNAVSYTHLTLPTILLV